MVNSHTLEHKQSSSHMWNQNKDGNGAWMLVFSDGIFYNNTNSEIITDVFFRYTCKGVRIAETVSVVCVFVVCVCVVCVRTDIQWGTMC